MGVGGGPMIDRWDAAAMVAPAPAPEFLILFRLLSCFLFLLMLLLMLLPACLLRSLVWEVRGL